MTSSPIYLTVEENGKRLSEIELYSNCVLMFFAGHETTTNLIGNGMLALLRHPNQLAKLAADLSLISTAVEELLRYDPPSQFSTRTATAVIELHNHQIQPGQNVMLCLAAANRDPDQFSNPNQLDITRTPNPHLTFGHGNHFCLGAPLARLEGTIAFRTLLSRLSKIQLAAQPNWQKGFGLRGLETLPILFKPNSHHIRS